MAQPFQKLKEGKWRELYLEREEEEIQSINDKELKGGTKKEKMEIQTKEEGNSFEI